MVSIFSSDSLQERVFALLSSNQKWRAKLKWNSVSQLHGIHFTFHHFCTSTKYENTVSQHKTSVNAYRNSFRLIHCSSEHLDLKTLTVQHLFAASGHYKVIIGLGWGQLIWPLNWDSVCELYLSRIAQNWLLWFTVMWSERWKVESEIIVLIYTDDCILGQMLNWQNCAH